jgi:hypothetical protein
MAVNNRTGPNENLNPPKQKIGKYRNKQCKNEENNLREVEGWIYDDEWYIVGELGGGTNNCFAYKLPFFFFFFSK